jgi:hypothetical protein
MKRAGFFTGRGYTTPALDAHGNRLFRKFLCWRVPLFEFTTDTSSPLTFHLNGIAYQPDNHKLQTDGGSIPPFLWGVPGLNPWAFPRAYPFHDSGFTYGGLYIQGEVASEAGCKNVFSIMSRQRLNELLSELIGADGGSWWDVARINAGVSIGSRWCWDEKAQFKARIAAGIDL